MKLNGSGPAGAWRSEDSDFPTKVRSLLAERPEGLNSQWADATQTLYRQRFAPLETHLAASDGLPAAKALNRIALQHHGRHSNRGAVGPIHHQLRSIGDDICSASRTAWQGQGEGEHNFKQSVGVGQSEFSEADFRKCRVRQSHDALRVIDGDSARTPSDLPFFLAGRSAHRVGGQRTELEADGGGR